MSDDQLLTYLRNELADRVTKSPPATWPENLLRAMIALMDVQYPPNDQPVFKPGQRLRVVK